jgi:REP element-mobilizing transposase RayT
MALSKKYDITFFTATILEWKYLLANDAYKVILANSLRYLSENGKVLVHAFVIMNNHVHLLWHILHPHKREDVQRDFLKYTSQMMIKDLRANAPALLQDTM